MTGTNSDWPKIAILNLFKHVMVCNGLASNEICTLLDFYKFFEKKNSQEKTIFKKKKSEKKKISKKKNSEIFQR